MAVLRKTLSPKEPKEDKKTSSNSALQNFLKTATHYNNVIPKETIISSGSLILDSDAQVRSGMIVRLVGKGSELGKAQPVWSNVLTPSGWKKIGELQVWDQIMNSQGGISIVEGVFPQGKRKINEFKFSDDSVVHCCDEHLWFTRNINDRKHFKKGAVRTSLEIKNSLRKKVHANHSIPFVKPIEFGNSPALKIDPYLMGMLLGDGSFRNRYNVGFTTADQELVNSFENRLPDNLKLKRLSKNSKYNYRIHSLEFVNIFAEMGLHKLYSHEKFIPKEYLTASIKDRQEILMGLMDTDGSADGKGGSVCEYSTTSPQLAEDVIFLAKSLGGKVRSKKRQTHFTHKGVKKAGKESYRVVMSFTDFCPFKLERKAKLYRNRERLLEKYLVDVKDAGEEECVCIKTSAPDSLYITDGFNLTHNTSQGFVFLENYMKTMPNAKSLYVKAEGRLSTKKLEKTGLKFTYKLEDWTEGTVFIVCSNIAEPIFKMIVDTVHDAYHAGEHISWMIDSMDGLILEDDLKKGVTNGGMVAGVPKLTKLLFRHLALPNMHYDSLGVITSQYSAQIKIDTYSPNAPNQGSSSSGSSAQHQADYVFEYQTINQGDLILENDALKPDKFTNKILGKFARVRVLKSADDITGNMYSIPIRRGEEYKGSGQLWQSKEICDLLLGYQLVSKGGAWLTFESDIMESARAEGIELQEKVNGINKLYAYLEDDKVVMEFLKKKILAIITE